MGPALVVLPNDAELNDALGDLDDFESGLVLGMSLNERRDGDGELVAGLLELGLRGLDHFSIEEIFRKGRSICERLGAGGESWRTRDEG